MLRRIVEEVLLGLERGPDLVLRAATVPLSPAREAELGVAPRREALHRAWVEAGRPNGASTPASATAAARTARVPPTRNPPRTFTRRISPDELYVACAIWRIFRAR